MPLLIPNGRNEGEPSNLPRTIMRRMVTTLEKPCISRSRDRCILTSFNSTQANIRRHGPYSWYEEASFAHIHVVFSKVLWENYVARSL